MNNPVQRWKGGVIGAVGAVVAVLLAFALAPLPAYADAANKTLEVTEGATAVEGQTYPTIQDAINYIYEEQPENLKGWTITVNAGTYDRFVVLSGMDDLTVKAADGANVTVNVMVPDGKGADENGKVWGTAPELPENAGFNPGNWMDLGGIVLRDADNVTLDGLNIVINDSTISFAGTSGGRHHMMAAISNHNEAGEYADNFTVRNCSITGDGTMQAVGSGTGNTGISIGKFSSFTIEGCTFSNLNEAIRGQSDGADVKTVLINNNVFNGCNFSVHEYAGDSVKGAKGTYSFTNNTVIGSADRYNKVYFEDEYVGNAESNGYNLVVTGNSFKFAVLGAVNLDDNGADADKFYADNGFNIDSFVVLADKAANQVEMYANYDAPSGAQGQWVLTGLSTDAPDGTLDALEKAIAEANETGATSLSFKMDDPENFVNTFTWYKDAAYWETYTGSLTIQKNVQGDLANPSDTFTFRVSLDNVSKGTLDIDGYTFVNGQTDVTVQGNSAVTINDIPAGATYTVEEIYKAGYTPVVAENATGTIERDQTATVSFTNDRSTPSADTVDVDKQAAGLDENGQTDVTLSIGSTQKEHNVAVLFVLDYSTSVKVRDEAAAMLQELASKENTNVKASVINYSATADAAQWTTIDANADVKTLLEQPQGSGTNYQAGLLRAQEALQSADIAGYETYLVTISDGITYLWTDEATDTTMSVWYQNRGNGPDDIQNANSVYDMKYGQGQYIPSDTFNALVSGSDDVKQKYENTLQYASPYDPNVTVKPEEAPYLSYNGDDYQDVKNNYLIGTEVAIYKTADLWKQLVGSVDHAYAYKLDENHWGLYPYGKQLMDWMAEQTPELDGAISEDTAKDTFAGIRDQILYTLNKGVVTDEIGSAFDLTLDANGAVADNTFTLTVGGQQLAGHVVAGSDPAQVVFGEPDAEGVYPYVVTYHPATDSTKEYFTWEINTPVEEGVDLALTYNLTLVSKSEVPGDHTVPTNEHAWIEYEDTDGGKGNQDFPVPEVTYTVDEPVTPEPENPEPENPSTTNPEPETPSPEPEPETPETTEPEPEEPEATEPEPETTAPTEETVAKAEEPEQAAPQESAPALPATGDVALAAVAVLAVAGAGLVGVAHKMRKRGM